MKICVYFQPKPKKDIYEGRRLRKSIKGALEILDIPYAKHLMDTYDIAHFISIDDELKITETKEAGIPVIFSALYCENDDSARVLTYSKEGEPSLSLKAVRTLNKVDVVLVNDEASKVVLEKNGVKTRIEIVSPGVNTSRFNFTSKLEADIFYHYYQIDENRKFAVIVGDYKHKPTLKNLISIAKACPELTFFALGEMRFRTLTHIRRLMPHNLRLYPLANDEIYCSMMDKASLYLDINNKYPSPITLLDAAASKTQIISLNSSELNNEMLTNLKAYITKTPDEVIKVIKGVMSGELENTSNEAYEFAKAHSLSNVGQDLVKIYQSLLGGNKND